LIPLPNIPVWSAAGNWSILPGVQGYNLEICLAAGSAIIAPAADVWQNAFYAGAPGMSNFCNNAVNSLFQVAFVKHEPGPLCTTLIDCPFPLNLDDCLRYYDKSYNYTHAPGTATSAPVCPIWTLTTAQAYGWIPFKKRMAKSPTVTIYNYSTSAASSVRDSTGADHPVTSVINIGETGFGGMQGTGFTTGVVLFPHYVADTGW
jgi:hypothetical protein